LEAELRIRLGNYINLLQADRKRASSLDRKDTGMEKVFMPTEERFRIPSSSLQILACGTTTGLFSVI
jgi:hypothetical protein